MSAPGSGRKARTLVLTLAVCIFPFSIAQAEDTASACSFNVVGEGRATHAIDGRSVALSDSREVRLAGIEVPLLARAGETATPAARAAKDALQSLVAGRDITLRYVRAESDRYGRIVAYAFTAGTDGSVQSALVAQGFARVAARVENRACADALLAQETAARRAKLGLWADPVYDTRRADNPAAILSEQGRFVLVEGKVLSVRESGGTIYMNFARRWSEGFAVTILKRHARTFATAGIEPKKLEGRLIRVRGFVEQRGGPRIEADRPEQIEIVGVN